MAQLTYFMPDFNKQFFSGVWRYFKRSLASAGYGLLEIVKICVMAGVTIAFVRYFLFKPFYVKGASMEPNYMDKEYLIIDELSYRFHEPSRGDVIVFHYPNDPKEYFLKRIIGLPGERVKISDGQITIYNNEHPEGFLLKESYIPEGVFTDSDPTPRAISKGQYFVMGDNRPNSFDSRRFGTVDASLIVGRTWLRGWPPNRITVFSHPNY